jgi:hypothetical protein
VLAKAARFSIGEIELVGDGLLAQQALALTSDSPFVVQVRRGRSSMAVFRIHLANGEGRIKADLKAADETLARLSAERWFGDADWQIAEIRRVDAGPEPAKLARTG